MMNRLAEAETLFEHTREIGSDESLVTVAVSLFNYARFVEECLDSIAAQTHRALELIVVDDNSHKDASVEVAQGWLESNAARFERVLLLRHVHNQGLAQARNTAFLHSKGAYVFVIDADNAIRPRCIARLLEAIEETSAQAAYTQIEFFEEQTQLGYADVWSRASFRKGNFVDAMALVSRRAWKEVDGYTHIEGGWEDYDFWCKFIEHGISAAFVPEILSRYRVHSTSMLRSETLHRYDSIKIEMSLRHPWLEL